MQRLLFVRCVKVTFKTDFIYSDPRSVNDCLKSDNNFDDYWLAHLLTATGLSEKEFVESFKPEDRPWIQEAVSPRVRL